MHTTDIRVESGFAAELSASLPYLAATLKAIHCESSVDKECASPLTPLTLERAFTCTACGSYENGIQGGLSMGTSIGVALKQKILGAQKTLWELGFYVSVVQLLRREGQERTDGAVGCQVA